MDAFTREALCVRVAKRWGERCRRLLLEAGLLEAGLKISGDEAAIYIPLKLAAAEVEGKEERSSLEDSLSALFSSLDHEIGPPAFVFQLCGRECGEAKVRGGKWRTLLEEGGRFNKELLGLLPHSFDIIGHILLIKLDEKLLPYKGLIGEALLKSFPAIRTVVLEEKVGGEFRIRNLSLMAGKDDFETEHREHGLRYRLDPGKVYFSPRLATERQRVLQAFLTRAKETGRKKERVLDMFAGVGPFSLLLAKKAESAQVVAVDKNPLAVKYLKENITLNRISGVEPRLGDALDVAGEFAGRGERFHCVIMNFPSHPDPFFPAALGVVERGGIIHFYRICEHDEVENVKAFLLDRTEKAQKPVKNITVREIRTYATTASHYAFDVVFE